MNGTGYDLKPEGSMYFGRFYAAGAPHLYIERRNDCSASFHSDCAGRTLNGSPANVTGDYWIVRLSNGTEVRLGYTTNSEQLMSGVDSSLYGSLLGYGGRVALAAVKRWRVDQITSVYSNNRIVFAYQEFVDDPSKTTPNDKWSLLQEIKYNEVSGGFRSWVRFYNNGDNSQGGVGPLYTRIDVFDGVLDNTPDNELVRRYNLLMNKQTLWECGITLNQAYLSSIQMYDRNGTQALPATTFEYAWLGNWGSDCYHYPRLARVSNGYGGWTDFAYSGDGYWWANSPCPVPGWPTDQCPNIDPDAVGQTYSVLETRTYDGLNAVSARVEYAYSGACRGNKGSPCAGPFAADHATIVGYNTTTVRAYGYDGVMLTQSTHQFHTDYARLGREYQTQDKNSSSTVLRQVDTIWGARLLGDANKDASNWTEATQHSRNGERAHTGEFSIKSIYTNTNCVAGVASVSKSVSVQPNTNYVLSGWIYREATTGAARLDLTPSGFSVNSTTQAGMWQYVSGTWNSGSNTSVQVRLVTDCNINGPAWFDDVSLAPSASPSQNLLSNASFELGANVDLRRSSLIYETIATDYTGSPPSTTRTDYSYDAYDNVTAEYQYGAEERVLNGGFEGGQSAWNFYWSSMPPASISQDTAFAGRRSLELANTMTSGGAYQDIEGLVNGQTYTVRVWVKGANIGTAGFRLWLHDTTSSNTITTDMTPGNNWQSVTLNYTANATGKVRVHLHLLAGTGKVYVDAVSVSRATDVGDERSIHRVYKPNTSTWIVSSVARESVYESIRLDDDAVNYLKSRTRYYYDNQVQWDLSPLAKGNLTAVERWAGSTNFNVTTYTYDLTWGYLTSSTDPNGNTSTITYDTTYRMFPLQNCSPYIANVGQLCTTTEYYGVGGIAADYGLPGQVKRVWDANGAATATQYRYDTFGRLTKVIKPGDTPDLPTISYEYTPVVETAFFDDFEACPTFPAGWTTWNVNAGCDNNAAYTGAWGMYLNGPGNGGAPNDPGALYRGSHDLSLAPYALYRVSVALKGTKGQIQVNLHTSNEGWRYAFTVNVPGAWQVVEGAFRTGANPGNGQLHVWALTPAYSVDAKVDRVQVLRAKGLRIITRQREVSGQSGTIDSYTYYDGLGRELQTRAEAVGGQWSVSSVEYDALGRGVKQYTPRFEGSSAYSVPTGPHTMTQYNALGQTVRTIAPDGTQTSAISGGRVLIAEDANRHIKLSHSDAFGQLIQVDETLSDWSDTFSDGQLSGWGYAGSVSESGGTINITGSGTWNNYISKALPSGVGVVQGAQGVSVDVKYDPGTIISTLYLSTGTWDQSNYRRWGVTVQNGNIYLDRYVGAAATRVTALLFPVKTNVWYRVCLSIGRDGKLIAAVWEHNNPTVRSVVKLMLNEFSNRDWSFFAQMHTGVGRLDNYDELTLPRTTYAYNTLGNLTTVTDTLNNVTTMSYDVLSRKTAMNDRDMGAWSYQYDSAGNLIRQTDARGQRICFYYDAFNRLTGKHYPSDDVCPATPSLNVTYTYDAGANGKGRRTGMSDLLSGNTTWTYDERGRVTKEVKAINGGGSFTTQYTYDSMDRVVTTTYPDGEVVRSTYNAAGQPATLRSDTYSYNYVNSASYNALGQTTEMKLGNGTLMRWGYRGMGGNWDTPPTAGLTGYGRLYRIRATAPYGEPLLDLRYGYDAVGNVTRVVDTPRQAVNWPTSGFTFQDTFNIKNTTNWTWSAHQTVPHPDGGNNVVRNVGTGSNYDANFYRSTYSLANGKGLQLRFKVNQTDTTAVFAVEANDSTYRRFGVIANEGKLYVQYRDDGATWRYPADILTNLQVNTWYVLRIVVDDSGRGFYVEAYQENVPTMRGSYNLTMPTGKAWRFHHWIYRGIAYLDDYREFNTNGLSWTPDERMGFTYDALDRLVGASPVNGGQGYNKTYSYNQIGNMTNNGSGTLTYPASGPNSVRPHAVTSWGSNTYGYDANGNQIKRTFSDSTSTLTYDAENRLTTVSGATSASFLYDGDGNRVKSVLGGVTTYYVGNYYEYVNSSTTKKYYYAGGQRVAMRNNNTLYYLLGDHLGSTSLTANSGGSKVAELRYHPYGETRYTSGTTPTSYQFTGQRNDSSIGLYFYNARYYDPALGRFIQADTIVLHPRYYPANG